MYGFFVYHIISRSFGSISFYHCIWLYVCLLMFNFINYIFLLLLLYILIYLFVFWLLSMFCSVYSVFVVLFCVLFVCKCILYCCHRVTTKFQLTNISYHIISYIIPYIHPFKLSSLLIIVTECILSGSYKYHVTHM